MVKLYFVAGASGSGKTSIMPEVKKILGDTFSVYDFDDIGVPKNADKTWRQESTEKWLQKLLSEGKDACLFGQIVLGEILACPSASQLENVTFCLLDVSDFERIERLKKRNTYGADQNMLNWSSWLRMHHQDPQWMQHVLKEGCWSGLQFSRWDQLTEWGSKAVITTMDTTGKSVNEVAAAVAQWITNQEGEVVPCTPFKVYKNLKDTFKSIDERLFAYNKKCVPATQQPEVITLNYAIKENDQIVGGICAEMYVWKIVYVSVLFVEKAHRHKGLAIFLLQRLEKDARALGATLVHLDTFEFQAKDFYLKQGYEIFGVLDDCPQGKKRYYLKKILA